MDEPIYGKQLNFSTLSYSILRIKQFRLANSFNELNITPR